MGKRRAHCAHKYKLENREYMIQIKDPSACCGCTACVNICSRRALALKPDKMGFLYPVADTDLCIHCGLCEKVCPSIEPNESRIPLKVYAAKSADERIKAQSSSGGAFTLFAESILEEGGVVFGARFNEKWEVVHDYTETREGLAAFRASKYVQSRIGSTYRQAKAFLQAGRKVLFTGTPCQIAGLKRYLRKAYDNLLTIDFVCHGVPAPTVWQIYLKEILAQQPDPHMSIKEIHFRDKREGWKRYNVSFYLSRPTATGHQSFKVWSSPYMQDVYMRAFLSDLTLRPSCYKCPAKKGKSGSDITIGDFWGIEKIMPDFDDDKGCSLVMLHNEKAIAWFHSVELFCREATYEQAIAGNPSIEHAAFRPRLQRFFLKRLEKEQSVAAALDAVHSPKLLKRIRRFIYQKVSI